MSKKKRNHDAKEEEDTKLLENLDVVIRECTPIEWAARLCADEGYYVYDEYRFVTTIQKKPIREMPIEAIRLGDLKKIQGLSERIDEIVQDLISKGKKDEVYVLMEEFEDDMRPFRTGKRYRIGDRAFISEIYLDESSGQYVETLPHELGLALRDVFSAERWEEMKKISIEDFVLAPSDGSALLEGCSAEQPNDLGDILPSEALQEAACDMDTSESKMEEN